MLLLIDVNSSYWDEKEILSDHYQRPYRYFMQLSDESSLDKYSYAKSKSNMHLPASKKSILHTVLKYVYIICIIEFINICSWLAITSLLQ